MSVRYAGSWSSTINYFLNDLVVSPIDSRAYVLTIDSLIGGTDPSLSPSWLIYSKPTFGVYVEATGGVTDISIPINGLTATGTVSICYVHVGTGGGPQYLKSITNSANTCDMVFNQVVEVGDEIIWQVLAF